jgi:hypothetical protein
MKLGQDNSGLNTPHPLTRTQATPACQPPRHRIDPVAYATTRRAQPPPPQIHATSDWALLLPY